MIRSAFYLGPDGEVLEAVGPEQMRARLATSEGLLWVDIEAPGEEDARLLSEVFGFHPLAIEDCVSTRIHRPKVDDFGSHLFIIVHGINYRIRSNVVETTELAIFMGSHFVVSSHNIPLRTVTSIALRLQQDKRVMARGADFLVHELIDALVDDILPTLDDLDEHTQHIESMVIVDPRREVLPSILGLKRSTLALRRVTQRELMNSLSRGDYSLITEQARIYYRDVYDHMVRIEDFATNLRDLADSALNSYLSSVSNHTNEVMKLLTLIATIFIPLTFIAGIYGMNFRTMPELEWRYGYYVILGIMVAVGGALAFYFRSRRWV